MLEDRSSDLRSANANIYVRVLLHIGSGTV